MRTYPQSKSPQNCDEKIPLVREGKHLNKKKRGFKAMKKIEIKLYEKQAWVEETHTVRLTGKGNQENARLGRGQGYGNTVFLVCG